MNLTERATHPSRDQIENLLDFLERNPSLAKGFSRVPSARDANRKTWEKLSVQLNSLGGCVKTWKQWTKYWADKKSAVKKKRALRFHAMNKADGAEIIELSTIEERILALMGAEYFAAGDRHNNKTTNPFEGTHFNQEPPETESNNPSLLADQVISVYATPQLKMEEQSTPSIVFLDMFDLNIPTLEVSESAPQRAQIPPCTLPRVGAQERLVSVTAPSVSGRHPQRSPLDVRRQMHESPTPSHPPTNTTATSRRSKRRRTLSPPSQRQSHLTSLAERFLRLEEQRTDIQQRNTQILEIYLTSQAESNRVTAQALQAVGDGLKMLAEALRK